MSVEECIGKVSVPLFLGEVSTNTCANRFGDDVRAMEVFFFEDINVYLDFDIIGTFFSSRIIFDGVNEVTYVDYI